MNTYKITLRGHKEKIAEGINPIDACKKIYPDLQLKPTKTKSIAFVCVELVNGRRKSCTYYTAHDIKSGFQCIPDALAPTPLAFQ